MLANGLRASPARADLPRLRLPLPAHRRRGRALVPQPGRTPGCRGPRGDLPDAAPVGSRRPTPACRASTSWPSGRGWSCTPDGPATDAARRSCSAPGVLWHLLRHGRRYDVVHTASFPYFSLLAAAAAPARSALPDRGGLARGLDARVLDRVPGPPGRARSATSCSASALASPASRRSASRACTRGGCATRGCERPEVITGQYVPDRRSASASRRPASQRGVRRPAHPREAGAGATRRRSPRARRRLPELRGEIFGDGPDRARAAGGDRGPGRRGTSSRRPGSWTATVRGARALPRALHGAAVEARGLRPGGARGRRRAARRAWWSPAPTTPPWSWSTRA